VSQNKEQQLAISLQVMVMVMVMVISARNKLNQKEQRMSES
jgi:hypothetical protein